MAKFSGVLGYGVTEEVETKPGIWERVNVERACRGDVLRNKINIVRSEHLNDNVTISNQVSIVADPYALKNFHLITYIKFMGVKWKVESIELEYPRIVLTLGGEYNE